MANGTHDLYSLLPAIYRERDAQRNLPLRALLSLLEEQRALVDADIQQLQENLFIETCDEWVIAYIADLVSNKLLFDPSRSAVAETAVSLFTDLVGKDLRPPVAVRIRADVAKTIHYRRRKATPAMLEELARDVTGWPAHVVEFFQLLGWTQFLEHQRPRVVGRSRSIDAMGASPAPPINRPPSTRVRYAADAAQHPRHRSSWPRRLPLVNVPAADRWLGVIISVRSAARRLFSRLGERQQSPLIRRAGSHPPHAVRQGPARLCGRGAAAATRLHPALQRVRRRSRRSGGRVGNEHPCPPSGSGIDPAFEPAGTHSFRVVCRRLDRGRRRSRRKRYRRRLGRLASAARGAINSVGVGYWYGFASSLGGGLPGGTLEGRALPTPPALRGAAERLAGMSARGAGQWQADALGAIISIRQSHLRHPAGSLPVAARSPGGAGNAPAAAAGGRRRHDRRPDAATTTGTGVFTLNGVVPKLPPRRW